MSATKNELENVPKNVTWRCEYPFRSHHFQVETGNVHFVDEGSELQSTLGPVLMVHGNPTWSFYYRRLISSLSSQRRVIAVDHLGCGLSDKPTDFDYCLENHIEHLVELIDHLDLSNVTLMAHDWGGAIGLGALLKSRSRFSRIILFNTGAFPPPYIPFRIRVCRWPLIGKLGVQGFNLFAKAAVTMATERPGGLPKTTADGLLAPYDSWNHRVAIYNFVKDIPLSKDHRTWQILDQIEKQLSELTGMPKLLVWGMKDWCFRPECLRRFQRHWPDAEVHELADAGHYVVEDAANEVDDLTRNFLTSTDGALNKLG
ncbi:MAG: alpha/beta fold hydrolase [Planctomycetota bacterium]